MNVEIKERFEDDALSLPKKTQLRIADIIEGLEKQTSLHDAPYNIKKLKGYRTLYRIRVGDYRLICKYVAPDLIMFCIIHRSNDYKILDKLELE